MLQTQRKSLYLNSENKRRCFFFEICSDNGPQWFLTMSISKLIVRNRLHANKQKIQNKSSSKNILQLKNRLR